LSCCIDGRDYHRKDAMLEGATHTGNSWQVALVLVEGRGPDGGAAVRGKCGLELGSWGCRNDMLLFLHACTDERFVRCRDMVVRWVCMWAR
jgi:hypothetical protein